MNIGTLVFAQMMDHLPLTTFRRCVARYGSEHKGVDLQETVYALVFGLTFFGSVLLGILVIGAGGRV